MLDLYGGRNILVPELKDPAIDPAAFAATILRRGIQDKVVVQTFSFPAAQALARSALQVLYLLRTGRNLIRRRSVPAASATSARLKASAPATCAA